MCNRVKKLITLAGDTGKSGCRLVSGSFDGEKLSIRVESRFDLYQSYLPDGWLYLDVVNIFAQLKLHIAKYIAASGMSPASLGVETWGGDYGLLDRRGTLMSLPLFYKNARFAEYLPEFLERVDMREVFFRTGMDVAAYNSPVRLFIQKKLGLTGLQNADRFLGIADLLSYFFSGRPVSELTSISVTRLVDLKSSRYSGWLLDKLGVDRSILKNEIMMPGSIIGSVLPQVGDELGTRDMKIVAVPGHDTAAAALAVPQLGENSIFLGSGTTLVFCSANRNLELTDKMYEFNTSIVKGFDNTDIMVRNFSAGMWLMHALRRDWPGGISYEEMYALAETARAHRSFIDIDLGFFETWGNVRERIADYCRATGQPVPMDGAAFIRCIVESYALKARWALDRYAEVLGRPMESLAVVGGGVYAPLLCQMLADATGRTVVAGASEATSAGNILTQLYALGEVAGMDEMSEIVKRSFANTVYQPASDREQWLEAYERYLKICDKFIDGKDLGE